MKMCFVLAVVLAALTACSLGEGPHRPSGSSLPEGQTGAAYIQAKPIFAKYCSACHPSRSGPDWLDYEKALRYVTDGELLRRIVTEKSMPPPGSAQAAAISDKEREVIGRWARLDGQQGTSASTKPAGPSVQVSSLSQSCLECHGANGPSSSAHPKIPRLAGQNSAYLKLQLARFKWRDRVDPTGTMNSVAYPLTESDSEDLAQEFSSLQCFSPENFPQVGNAQSARGKILADALCVSCHMNAEFKGKPTNSLVPILAGQSGEYLFNQLLYFRENERRSPMMHEFAKGLSNQNIEDLAIFFSMER